MKNTKILLVSIFSAVLISACSTSGNMKLQHENQVSIAEKIKQGITNKQQVYQMLGAPLETSLTENGLEIAKYEFTRTTPQARNFIPYNVFSRVSDGEHKELVILFDDNNLVKKFVINESDIQKRRGIVE
ncbi:outer membrane protein assembly factor BamE [Congregibacter sp.]|jgi:outer membrane protein assembly factor BamE (lipoprotein component of BamABCDE complex)|uniref:outer membrane protein assembly factor BamE domain-containing protein n=1 Tax=Congregibacter sp. TaxID=2744308 RepID=UPI0039E5465E